MTRRCSRARVVVVGVARDVAGFRIGGMRLGGAGVYMPIGAEAARTSLTMRVRGDSERARHALVDRLAAIDPNMSEVSTLQTIARAESVSSGDSVLADAGAWSAGASADVVGSVQRALLSRRATHQGDRRADGAWRNQPKRRRARVVAVGSPVGIGLLIGSSLTAALGAALLATPAAEQIGSAVRLFDPVAYAASLLCIVTACACAALIPALRAARINPVAALRQL